MTKEGISKRILLVDDDADILVVTRTALEVMGNFVADSCSSATEALAYLEEFRPDLILVDVMMPDLDGISFVRELKKSPQLEHIPVLFMTARTQTEDIEGYLAEGVAGVISKPFDPEALIQRLNAILQPSRLTDGSKSRDLSQKLRQLQQLYADQLPIKIREIEAAWDRILLGGEIQETTRRFYRLIHSMTGAGATFGYNTLSIMARVLENFLRPLVDDSAGLDTRQQEEISRIIGLLHEAAETPEAAVPAPEEEQETPRSKDRRSDKTVFLMEENKDELANLVHQLQFFGYSVRGFSDVDKLRRAMAARLPSILVMNTRLESVAGAGIAAAAELNQKYQGAFLLVFLADSEDLETHLLALRGGGMAFFAKPFDLGELIDKIDLLTGQKLDEPYRILIVEDDAQLAAYYQLTLEQAGIQCLVAGDALDVLVPIRTFRPDLILLDIYMANCSGLELASMLRQRESLLGISIVFLSTEAALETQSAGIALGAEDYLTKPIQAGHLVSVLMPRLERSRTLRDIMDRDGLTGLLNHTKTKVHLDNEWKKVQTRPGASLVFVMIDIDHFKNVNDTYGHATGDRILKSLARLLKQRLRQGDVIGRYGGEEFAVILPETGLAEATMVIDGVRESFGGVVHVAGDQKFKVTISCGLAQWPEFKDITALSDAADSALYRAKADGRNRIVQAVFNEQTQ